MHGYEHRTLRSLISRFWHFFCDASDWIWPTLCSLLTFRESYRCFGVYLPRFSCSCLFFRKSRKWDLCALCHGIQISMEAILACHPARSTEWLDCHPKSCELWRICTGPIVTAIILRLCICPPNHRSEHVWAQGFLTEFYGKQQRTWDLRRWKHK